MGIRKLAFLVGDDVVTLMDIDEDQLHMTDGLIAGLMSVTEVIDVTDDEGVSGIFNIEVCQVETNGVPKNV